jgi:hypothetical protein
VGWCRAGRQDEAVSQYRSALQMLLQPPLAATRVANKAAVVLRCNVAAALLKQGTRPQPPASAPTQLQRLSVVSTTRLLTAR